MCNSQETVCSLLISSLCANDFSPATSHGLRDGIQEDNHARGFTNVYRSTLLYRVFPHSFSAFSPRSDKWSSVASRSLVNVRSELHVSHLFALLKTIAYYAIPRRRRCAPHARHQATDMQSRSH